MISSRERIHRSILHKEPDRIPIDNNGFISGMHIGAYKKLLKFLNIEEEINILDPVQKIVSVKDEVKDLLGVDTRYIYAKPCKNYDYKINMDGTFKDEFGAIYKNCGYYADIIKHPLRGKSFSEVKSYRFPDPKDPARFESLDEESKRLFENTEYSLWAGTPQPIFYMGYFLRSMEDFMADIYINPKLFLYLIDKITDWVIGWYEGYMDKIGNYIEVFWLADDWGCQTGPIISPAYFRKEFVPRYRNIIKFIKTKTNAKCCYHSDGSVYWCLEDLIEMGVDIVNPIQPNAKDNNTAIIKKEFGNRVCFHGGTDNQGIFHKNIHILSIDTLKRIIDLAPGGGYIFSSGINIQPNMPPENILRFFEICRVFGKYPINFEEIEREIEREKKKLNESL